MKNIPSFVSAAIAFRLVFPLSGFGSSGPRHLTFRPLSMGNAFVAVVDDKDALYYNPAGLNLINNRNGGSRSGLAEYPRDRWTRLDLFGTTLSLKDMLDFLDVYNKHRNSFGDLNKAQSDSTLVTDLTPFDRKPIQAGVQQGIEFNLHNFGFAYWTDAQVAPYVDEGVLLPQAGIETLRLDAVFQIAGARSFLNEKLLVGVGYRLANRQEMNNYQIAVTDFGTRSKLIEAALDTLDRKMGNFTAFENYGHGVDLGALWQQTPWLRFGAVLQNAGMFLNGNPVTWNFTVGAAATPFMLQKGGRWARKVDFAVDLEDLFNNDHGYKPLNKLNFGGEVEQIALPWVLKMRLGAGFKGGYWTAGLGLTLLKVIHLDAVSWAEEAGYYTGEIEDRYYAVNLGLGI